MYARSTTINAAPASVDAGIAQVRDEVMPMLLDLDGCIGLSMIVDRESGRCIATSAWQSEEAMRASDEALRPVRERIAESMGGSGPQVQEWEIAVLHRMHNAPEGACARVIWIQGDPARMEDATSTMRTVMLSKLEELPGFCSVSMLVDRATGRGVTAAVYDSRDAMARAADRAKSLREDFTREMGMEITEVAEFELALAHLRVPETV